MTGPRRLLAPSLWGLSAQSAQFALSLLLLILVAPWITPEQFGVAGLVAVLVGWTASLADLGLGVLCVQQTGIDQARAARSAALAGWGLAAVLATAAPWIAPLLRIPTLLLQAGALAIPLAGVTATARARLARDLQFPRLALLDTVVAAAVLAATVLGARRGLGEWALVGADVAGAAVAAAVAWLLAPRARRGGEAPLYDDGRRVVAARLADAGFRESDRLIVGACLGNAALGLYRFGLRHSLALVDRANAVADQVALPVLTESREDRDATAATYLRLVRGYALLLGVAGTALTWAGPPLLRALYPEPWHAVEPLLLPLGWAVLAAGFNGQPGALWLAHGDTRRKLRWSVANLVSLAVLVPAALAFGVTGVIWTLAARSLVAAILAHAWSARFGVTMTAYARAVAPALIWAGLHGLALVVT